MAGIAPRLPLRKEETDGYGLIKSYGELAHQNLKMLILTSPGERVMHPEFGVGLRRYLFEPNNPLTYNDIETAIRRQVANYLPYIRILSVTFNKSREIGNEDQILSVSVEYFVTPLQVKSVILFDMEWKLTPLSLL